MALGRPGISGYPEIAGDIGGGAEDTTSSYPIKIGGIMTSFGGASIALTTFKRAGACHTNDGRPYVEIGHITHMLTTVAYNAIQNATTIIAGEIDMMIGVYDLLVSAETVSSFSFGAGPSTTPTWFILDMRVRGNETKHIALRQPLILTSDQPLIVSTDTTKTSVYVGGFVTPAL